LLDGDVAAFAHAARAAGVEGCRDEDDPATAFGRVLVARVEPALAREPGWVFLERFPAFGAALAQLAPEDPRVALRVEAYLYGLEIANGYVELDDAAEHRRRWANERAQRGAEGAPVDEAFLEELATEGLPPTVGMALGVDRLAMALRQIDTIAELLPFALERRPEP
jgi:lysyl-tRNA synthetase class 2